MSFFYCLNCSYCIVVPHTTHFAEKETMFVKYKVFGKIVLLLYFVISMYWFLTESYFHT